MVAGVFWYILAYLPLLKARAAEADQTETADPIDNYKIRIALIYGSSVGDDFRSQSETGFLLGTNDAGSNSFTTLLATGATELNVTVDRNLTKSGSYYTEAAAGKGNIGAYHLQLTPGEEGYDALMKTVEEALPEADLFMGYEKGVSSVMIGQYKTADEAEEALAALRAEGKEALAEPLKKAAVSSPSDTALLVVDPSENKILMKYDSGDGNAFLGLRSVQNEGTHTAIRGYKSGTRYTYDDVLECAVYKTADAFGVKVINVLPIETYVTGVIPYEIGNSWPLETQKAFAIAARSYAISNKGRHKSAYNADLCCSSDCQVYRGFGSTNSLVRQAVEETKGQIAAYKGRVCGSVYSSSTGGCTANASQVWGSSSSVYGYLTAVATPWENYENYGNGSWTSTATGQQLTERLNAKGYTGLTGPVTEAKITQLENNSSYVYAMAFSDAAGHTVTVTRTDKVKSLLSPYVKSGNFVVAKAGESVTRTNFGLPGFRDLKEFTTGMAVKGNPRDYAVFGRGSLSVLTAGGLATMNDTSNEAVITAGGILPYDMSHELDGRYYATVVGLNGSILPNIPRLETVVETETLKAEGPAGSFVFIGRGWGHGVGMSQWGIKDLGDLGYDYQTILKAYYTGIDIVTYAEYLKG